MNRRSFLRSLIAAPIAAAVAPMAARPAYATGGLTRVGGQRLVGECVAGQSLWVGHVGPEVVVTHRPATSEIRRLFSEGGAEAIIRNNAEMMRHVRMQSDKLSPFIDHGSFDRLSEWLDTPVEAEHLSTAIPMGMTGC